MFQTKIINVQRGGLSVSLSVTESHFQSVRVVYPVSLGLPL